jgi:uncharacterized protein
MLLAMRCPRDGSELSTKIYEANVEVDECPTCAGVFLDDGELEAIQKAVAKNHSKALATPVDSVTEGFASAQNEELPHVDCLRCGARMERRRYGLGSQTVIDECPKGCGLWLDGGELQQLERFYEQSNEEVSIPVTFRIWAAVRGALAKKR